ncbi:MAG: CBS domain-containing protein, partial [Candidatus Binatia bacterium]
MIVRDCMTTTVQVVHPEDDVATVRETFRRRRIRQLPVVAAGRVIGIISDRDVRTAVDGHTTVDTLMTPTPLTTSPSTPVEVAATMLRTRKIGALPV